MWPPGKYKPHHLSKEESKCSTLFPVQILLLAIFLVSTFSFSAENHKDKIIIGESARLHSDILGEERTVYISLPSNYHRNIHSYPVIIVMDAEYLFEAANAIVKPKTNHWHYCGFKRHFGPKFYTQSILSIRKQ
ncbi:hypothetical protein [Microbulbifer spongiae]|uniref:Uncharacterized protein n=1 Tax=Microbulbifer spongiae TaxID=2944933 RepID=A0ABY9EFR3_9GAMM|nr:hypothetical protein [Microbulbifer sp. MI-G]WKD51266.1 hypothetical protein M8T91_07570 [Microbulbifer sp. MI-G]